MAQTPSSRAIAHFPRRLRKRPHPEKCLFEVRRGASVPHFAAFQGLKSSKISINWLSSRLNMVEQSLDDLYMMDPIRLEYSQ